MSDTLYTMDLLRLAADAHGAGKLAVSSASGHAFNPACGDKVAVDLLLAGGKILEMAHETKACVLAQASSSILGQALRGADQAAVERLHASVEAMLISTAAPPPVPFERYAAFQGAVEYPSRHRCVLLPIQAVLDALDRSSRATCNEMNP
ncbi:MAG TPA: iron-sulfur cluster assembly scaffold protein [Rhizomicrobium sp.]|jgi:nitrogen fixation NifU-like protein|nr:iron-sulfur cluster assembly scaffold protein [Rhizomicrobium sp.]